MFRAALLTVLFRQTVVLLFFAWVCFPLAALAQGEQDSVLGWQGTPMRLDVACFFPLAGQPISGTVEISETEAWKKWQKEGKSPTCHVCVTLSKEAVTNPAEAAWHSEPLTIQTGPIAFSVPAGTLAPGTYLLSVWAMSPDGKDCRKVSNRWNDYNDTLDLSPTLRLMVRAAGSVNPAYSVSLHTTSALLTKARSLGSPNRERFPKDDEGDCYARGVRCLCAFDDRLFIGCGDGNANRGPIDIFTYVPAADGVHDGTFAKEFTVDEEAIDCFRAWGDNLYVPGTDAKEDWAFGNLYVRRAGQWSKERTIPRGLHVFDCARLGETLYVGVGGIGSREKETGRLWRSFDDGKTWTHCGQDRPTVEEIATLRFYALAPFAGGVLVFDAFAKQGPLLWRSKELTRQDCPLFGAYTAPRHYAPMHPELFAGGVLYIATVAEADKPARPRLFHLKDLAQGGAVVMPYPDAAQLLLCIDDDNCFLLACDKTEKGYICQIAQTTDLHDWTTVATVTLPAPPGAIAHLQGKLYIGLKNEGSNAEAGSLYVVE